MCHMEKEDVLYNLDKNLIDQLHNATLNMSKQCFEIKKICLTIELTVLTFVLNFVSNNDACCLYIAFLGLAIPLSFWILDSLSYYYQDSLRSTMIKEGNRIRDEYRLSTLENKHDRNITSRLFLSFFNLSQLLYYILIVADYIFIFIYLV